MSFRAVVSTVSLSVPLALSLALTTAPGNVQLTGTQLASALVPASYFPAGWSVQKTGAYNSGNRLENSPAKYNLATMSCKTFVVTAPDKGFGETATAASIVHKKNQAYSQNVYQFASSAKASAFYNGMYALFERCRTVSTTSGSLKVKLTTRYLTKTHEGGHQAFRTLQTLYVTSFSPTINDTLFVVDGKDVFTIDAAGQTEPTKPALPTATLHLITRVQAVR
jgi:hypothetical protein